MKDLVLDWGERLVLLSLFALFVAANFRSGDPINMVIIVGETMTAFFVLTRRRAISISENPVDWALAFAGTMAPLLIRPGGEPLAGWLAAALVTGGTLFAVAAKLSLNRRFGIAPANRGVQSSWSYALVRHPMYLGYIVCQVGYLLHNPTAANLAVYACAWLLQVARIGREERHLMQDEAYRDYARRVRHRLVPHLY
jgi:protein-S-isoprenylcysteine O-methyltransferase Ste14